MRVAIIGGGPAGAVCALSLLRGAGSPESGGRGGAAGQAFEVCIFDGKSFRQIGPRGCNMCAGVISGSLLERLAELGAEVPPAVVQRHITGHYFETRAGGVHIPKDPESSLCTVFRSAGPRGCTPVDQQSFDQFLLGSALAAGASHVGAHVAEVSLPEGPAAPFGLRAADGRVYSADVVVGAFGVNTALATRFEKLGFGYRQPATLHVAQADLPLDEDAIEEVFRGEIRIFSLGLPGIRFGALTPKRRHVTVTVIGANLTRADLGRFLAHPRVRRHFPDGWELPPSFCHCQPRLPITAARHPVSDRLIVVGDANVSRYLKGGIESAFFTGSLAAQMIASGRLSREELQRGYVRACHARYRTDNLFGRFLFGCNDLISRLPAAAAAGLWLVEQEERMPRWQERRHTRILWHIFAGDAPYREIARQAFSPVVVAGGLRAMLPGGRGTPPPPCDLPEATARGGRETAEVEGHQAVNSRPLGPAEMGPLADGQTVAIIGGGPGGIACALTLKREAARRNVRLNVIVFEGKRFGVHYNQCAGVLSPPLQQILEKEHGIVLPGALCQREIRGYVLHSESASITLSGPEHGGASLAVRRVEFDEFLERVARERGIEIVDARATDLEFRRDEVVVFTWGGTFRAAAVVGAFGLSRAMTATLSRWTPYRPPRALDTVATKFHPAGTEHIPGLLGDQIHVLLPALPRVEFGALIPKGNHVAVILAGEGVGTDDMDAFLALPPVRRLFPGPPVPEDYFKGRFPVSLASGAFGNRYVTIGDAAGLVRPFKGKGINSAIVTGAAAATTMMEVGVSEEAFRAFYRQCAEITRDVPYGRLVRALAGVASHRFSLDPVIREAERSPALRELLFDCVSGRETYRRIVRRPGNLPMAMRLGLALLADRARRMLG